MTIVMKFGGASVATADSFHQIAKIIDQSKRKRQCPIVVIVSAMANTTDQLLNLAKAVHPNPPCREQDMLVSVGERISIALLAMALSLRGVEAVSFTGSQSGIVTDECHTEARIWEVKPMRIVQALQQGKVAIVAGFQGVSRRGEITTLGRGGSDTSAVAMAAALKVTCVDFYKDVDGIYCSDPKKCVTAKKIKMMGYNQAKQLVNEGAKVLHLRSILLAEKNGIRLRVRSFHKPTQIGTLVGDGALMARAFYEKDNP
jgi:aspartate kinase